ncbi:unnamed protein product, partial [Mesorhabditis belari]|uniref:Neurotransmitter-gated ion-channel ligand-binding domain-containing protein n=1 Tax=Mesorhabditis belari TaxID=2138241 RepID=A0AAF3EIK1_9BILA
MNILGNSDGSSLQVIITIQLLYVLDLDVAQQYLSVYVEQEIEWQDVRLRWDPADYGGLDVVWVLCDQVWTTDLFNSNSLTVNEIYPDRLKQCKVHSNGSIHSDMFLQIDSACFLDVQKFPFDKQTCEIPFVTIAFEPKTFDLQGKLFTKYIGFTPQGNGEWNVLSLNMTKDSQLKSSSDNKEFSMVVFILKLQREPSFYFYVITLPCFLLTFLRKAFRYWVYLC